MDWRMLLFYYEDTQRVFALCQRSPQIIPKTHQNLSCKVLLLQCLLCFLFGFCSFKRKVIPKSLKDFASRRQRRQLQDFQDLEEGGGKVLSPKRSLRWVTARLLLVLLHSLVLLPLRTCWAEKERQEGFSGSKPRLKCYYCHHTNRKK